MTFQEFLSQTRDLIENSNFTNKSFLCDVEQWSYEKSPNFKVYVAEKSDYVKSSTPEDCISKLSLMCQSLPIQTEMQISEDVEKCSPFDDRRPVVSMSDPALTAVYYTNNDQFPEFPFPEETPLGEQIDGGNEIEEDNGYETTDHSEGNY